MIENEPDPHEVARQLRSCGTREDATRFLTGSGLTVPQLKRVAREGDLTIGRYDTTKTDLIGQLVNSAVGRRLDRDVMFREGGQAAELSSARLQDTLEWYEIQAAGRGASTTPNAPAPALAQPQQCADPRSAGDLWRPPAARPHESDRDHAAQRRCDAALRDAESAIRQIDASCADSDRSQAEGQRTDQVTRWQAEDRAAEAAVGREEGLER